MRDLARWECERSAKAISRDWKTSIEKPGVGRAESCPETERANRGLQASGRQVGNVKTIVLVFMGRVRAGRL